jgi:organic hydroperoxide reductase OsmC/OhrA
MPMSTVEIRSVAGTQSALGWADTHTVVIDRPEGRAGGMGLGFNGAQLLGLAIGGCFANDLRYVAAELGLGIEEIRISVSVVLEGSPLRAVSSEMQVCVSLSGGADPTQLIARTKEVSMAMNSLREGLPVTLTQHAPSSPRSPAAAWSTDRPLDWGFENLEPYGGRCDAELSFRAEPDGY